MKQKSYIILLLALFMFQCSHRQETPPATFPGKPEVPAAILAEHKAILRQSHQLTLLEDSAGIAAKKLHELMLHHFSEEENVIFPPLGLLPALANGELPEQTGELTALCDQIKTGLTHMTVEHQLISAYLKELKQVSEEQDMPTILVLEEAILQHAKTEEEIYFPAAILVGEYLKSCTK